MPTCAVCEALATHNSSRCHAATYCSSAHQAMLWPAHKALCGKETDFFYQADLSRTEAEALFKSRNTPGPSYLDVTPHPDIPSLVDQAARDCAPGGDPIERSSTLTDRRWANAASSTLNPSSAGISRYAFYHIHSSQESVAKIQARLPTPLPERTFLPVLNAVFDYCSGQFLVTKAPAPPGEMDTTLLEAGLARVAREVEAIDRLTGVGEPLTLSTAVKMMRIHYRHLLRHRAGVPLEVMNAIHLVEMEELEEVTMAGVARARERGREWR